MNDRIPQIVGNAIAYLVLLAVIAAFFIHSNIQRRMIELSGWDHGYVICNDRITVGWGHENDDEYFKLLDKAEKECP